MLLAPLISDRKGEHIELFIELKAKGFTRVRIDGAVVELDPTPKLSKNQKHTIGGGGSPECARCQAARLAESFETACRMGNGRTIVVSMDDDAASPQLFSSNFCPVCDYSYCF